MTGEWQGKRDPGWDADIGLALRQPTEDKTDRTISVHVVDTTNLAADTYDTIITTGEYTSCEVIMACSGGVTVKMYERANSDQAWNDVTPSGRAKEAQSQDNASYVDQSDTVVFLNVGRRQLKLEYVTSDASNSVDIAYVLGFEQGTVPYAA